MKVFKFSTKISENGTIQLPLNPLLLNKEVEIIVFPKQTTREKNHRASEFVSKWAGFLSVED